MSCLHAAQEFELAGIVELYSENGPLIRIPGKYSFVLHCFCLRVVNGFSSVDCAIAVGFKGFTGVAGTMIKAVIDSLRGKWLDAPWAPRVGGASISKERRGVKRGRLGFDST